MKIMRFIILLSAFAGSMMAVKSMEKDDLESMEQGYTTAWVKRSREGSELEQPQIKKIRKEDKRNLKHSKMLSKANRMIESGEDLNAFTMHAPHSEAKFTPLMKAAYYGFDVIVELLLDHGVQTEIISFFYGTALQIAVYNNHENCAKILLKHGANSNYVGLQSLLGMAIEKENLNLCQILLKHKADPNFIWFHNLITKFNN